MARVAAAQPAMAGGVFAITKEWFFGSGGYDEHLEVWGVENIEMALRVWTCGGELLTLPCSRVGHVFRHAQPFAWPNASGAITVRRKAFIITGKTSKQVLATTLQLINIWSQDLLGSLGEAA